VRRGNLYWRPGDTFLIYPRGELSSRLISLRAGVVAAEKMRILKEGERGMVEKALKKLGEPYGYKGAVNNAFDFSAFRRAVEEFLNAGSMDVASTNKAPMKVGTYNIRLSGVGGNADFATPNVWVDRKKDLANQIRKMNCDVFGLQEVFPEQLAFLRGELPEYEFVGEHRGADRKSDEASPVCYRKSRFEAIDKGTFGFRKRPMCLV
jgi:hypothetical protein